MRMRNLPGVNRPGIAVVFPTFKGPVTICDVGANIACKPINLYQYAVMASMHAKHLLGVENPRVGLMSIGAEDAKGNEIVKKTRELMKSDPKMNFIGNIEGGDIFRGACDVVISDGFVGNVIGNEKKQYEIRTVSLCVFLKNEEFMQCTIPGDTEIQHIDITVKPRL